MKTKNIPASEVECGNLYRLVRGYPHHHGALVYVFKEMTTQRLYGVAISEEITKNGYALY